METANYPETDSSAKRWYAKRWVWICAAAVVAVAVGAGVVYGLYRSSKAAKVQSALSAADTANAKGDYQAAIDQLSGALSQSSNTQDKVKLYDSLASSAASNGNVGNAIHYYELKHQLAPDTAKADANMLGSLYERAGKFQLAIAQYKLAVAFFNSLPQTAQNRSNAQSLQARIRDLGGQ